MKYNNGNIDENKFRLNAFFKYSSWYTDLRHFMKLIKIEV